MSDDAVTTSNRLFDPRDVAGAWGLVLAYGVVCLALGIVLAVWPEETLKVVAVLIGIQLLLSGVLRIVLALTASEADTGVRVLAGLTGGLALVVGLLCLRDPVQTILIVGLLLGVWWVVSGVVDVITAVISPVPGRRAWDLGTGVISIMAGGFLLVNPELSLGVLVFVVCAWLLIAGVIAVVVAFKLRGAHKDVADAAATSPAPAV